MKEYYNKSGIRVRTSKKEDIEFLKDHLKKSDVEEIWASHHIEPLTALQMCLEQSIFCATVENGYPICMFGVSAESILGEKGVIWMLSSEELDKISYRLIKHSKQFIDIMLSYYSYLENYVHIKNRKSIKWLRMCGANFSDAQPYGLDNELFYHFFFQRGE